MKITILVWMFGEGMKERYTAVPFCGDYLIVEELYSTSNKVTIELSYDKRYLHPDKSIRVKLKFDSHNFEEKPAHELVYVSENTGK